MLFIRVFLLSLAFIFSVQAVTPVEPSNAGNVTEIGAIRIGYTLGFDWSSDGSQLIVQTTSGLRFYNIPLLAEGYSPITNYPVTASTFSADNNLLAYVDGNNVLIQNLSDATTLLLPGSGETIQNIAFSPDSSILAAASGSILGDPQSGSLRIWNVNTGSELQVLETSEALIQVVFSLDGSIVYYSIAEGGVYAWEIQSNTQVFHQQAHQGLIFALVLSPDGRILATGGNDGTVNLRDAASGELMARYETGGERVSSLAFHPSENLLAASSADGIIRVWNLSDNIEHAHFIHTHAINHVEFQPDSSILTFTSQSDNMLRFWDISTEQIRQDFLIRTTDIHGLAFNEPLNMLAAANSDGTIRHWNAESLGIINTINDQTSWVGDVIFNEAGMLQISVGADRWIQILDLTTSEVVMILEGHQDAISSLAIKPKANLIASGSFGSRERAVRLWDITSGEQIAWLENVDADILDIQFHPTEDILAIGLMNGDVLFWNFVLDEIQIFFTNDTPINTITFSSDGTIFAAGDESGMIRMWNNSDYTLRSEFSAHTSTINDLAFNPANNLLASASDDSTIKLWNSQDGELLTTLYHPFGAVTEVLFKPDGTSLFSAGNDSTIRVWSILSS